VVGFDEIAALYRQSRRALVADLVRAKVPPDGVTNWITEHVPANVEPQHRQKFVSDALAELEHLDASRIGGLGITRQELEAWRALRPHKRQYLVRPPARLPPQWAAHCEP
jgi:hypothetical protein